MVQSPIDISLRLCLQSSVVEKIGKRHEAIYEIRTTLPRFSRSAQPATVGANIGPGLVQVSAQTVCLDLQLLPQPSNWPNRTERQMIERVCRKRRTIFDGGQRAGCRARYRSSDGGQQSADRQS